MTGSAVPRRLPSLDVVKTFEAAARHESFTRAAEELCVTQAAVSHQVKALEAGARRLSAARRCSRPPVVAEGKVERQLELSTPEIRHHREAAGEIALRVAGAARL